jgi:hypothetical protein
MEVFAQQCLDLARAILLHSIPSINEDGTITPAVGDSAEASDPGRVAFSLGEFYRATQETTLGKYDLIDLSARCLTAQIFTEAEAEEGLGFVSLGLLSFGPSKERNAVWERLLDPTREQIDKKLLQRADYHDYRQAFNIAKAVARFSLGLSKKDETSKLIDLIVQRTSERSSEGFVDNSPDGAFAGAYDMRGLWAFIFVRQALQLHANIHLRDRKVASLRTVSEKYLKLLPDMIRPDGVSWAVGPVTGIQTQTACISIILQAFRDGWIAPEKEALYTDIFRRLFSNFFASFIDQETGNVIVRDAERDASGGRSALMNAFDAARALCQWARLSRSVKMPDGAVTVTQAPILGRWTFFDRSARKEQGVFTFVDRARNLFIQLPLVAGPTADSSSLAFPHMPGVFDYPVGRYLPVLLPELTFEEGAFTPSHYGKSCTAGLLPAGGFFFKYEQPEAISSEQNIINGLGSWKVQWSFKDGKITGDFLFSPRRILELKRFRYLIALGSPHSYLSPSPSLRLGEEGQKCQVLKDDFQGAWLPAEEVTSDPNYRTAFGTIHYLQTLERSYPLTLRPGKAYQFSVSFEPKVVQA